MTSAIRGMRGTRDGQFSLMQSINNDAQPRNLEIAETREHGISGVAVRQYV